MRQEENSFGMERVNRIWQHIKYQQYRKRIEELEADRIFCGHAYTHFLDVARIAYIEALEKNIPVEKEIIYAAALLHDIGRYLEYEAGIPHHEASVYLAEPILLECGFSGEETAEILGAIAGHRDQAVKTENSLAGLIYRADKKSRCCYGCDAEQICDWEPEKKNLVITI